MSNNEISVMLHYTKFGIQRSPNTQFDILRNNTFLNEYCTFTTLDQSQLPSKMGHLRSILYLKKKIQDERPDIVHIIGVKEGFHCVIAAVLAGCKKRVIITHGFAGYAADTKKMKQLFFRWIIEPLVLMFSTDVQCNSWYAYNCNMVKLFARNKRTIVYNFMELPRLNTKSVWRLHNGISQNDFMIVTIGNMHQGKGYDIVQNVIEHFSDRSEFRFVIIGGGVLKKPFDTKLSDYIQKKKVFSLGKLPHAETMQILSEADLFFLPTRFETLGMVFAEAGYCGVPSVATDVGAVSEIVLDGITGYTIQVNNYAEAINRISELYDSKDTRSRMGACSKKHIQMLFSTEKTQQDILRIYQRKRTQKTARF